MLFIRGNAISGAPSIKGTNQFPGKYLYHRGITKILCYPGLSFLSSTIPSELEVITHVCLVPRNTMHVLVAECS
jgi:hypothetical protein